MGSRGGRKLVDGARQVVVVRVEARLLGDRGRVVVDVCFVPGPQILAVGLGLWGREVCHEGSLRVAHVLADVLVDPPLYLAGVGGHGDLVQVVEPASLILGNEEPTLRDFRLGLLGVGLGAHLADGTADGFDACGRLLGAPAPGVLRFLAGDADTVGGLGQHLGAALGNVELPVLLGGVVNGYVGHGLQEPSQHR